MRIHFDNPFVVFVLALLFQGLAAFLGDFFRKRTRQFKQGERHDFDTVQAATLTILALIIGFTFSMAVSRYDQRKTLEEAEANAIGTEYLRTDLLPGDLSAHARELLRKYLDLRIAFYEGDGGGTGDIEKRTANLQNVINSQGYTQAAWWNRIPIGAWAMMALMAISCNLLVGYGERRKGEYILFILPVVVSVGFFLIADLDSPRGGVIRVHPQNLQATAQSLPPG